MEKHTRVHRQATTSPSAHTVHVKTAVGRLSWLLTTVNKAEFESSEAAISNNANKTETCCLIISARKTGVLPTIRSLISAVTGGAETGHLTSVLHELVELLQEVISLLWIRLFIRLTHTQTKVSI